jgi:predicted aspartyl protease
LRYRADELYPVEIGKFGYPYVTIFINGEKLKLAWDTGNLTGLVLNSDIAARLKLPVVDASKSYDSSGAVVGTFRVFNVKELSGLGRVWTNVPAHEIKTTDFDGLIGPRFLAAKRFTLDYRSKLIAISDRTLVDQKETDGAIIPLIKSPVLKEMIVIRGTVNGKNVLMQLDTGKSRTSVDASLVASEKLHQSANGYRIDEIKIGPYSFSVPSARQDSFKGISEGLPEPILIGIGSDILSQVVFTVDYSRLVLDVSTVSSGGRSSPGVPLVFLTAGAHYDRLMADTKRRWQAMAGAVDACE